MHLLDTLFGTSTQFEYSRYSSHITGIAKAQRTYYVHDITYLPYDRKQKAEPVEQKNYVSKFAHEFATPKASELPIDKHNYLADCRTTHDDRRQPKQKIAESKLYLPIQQLTRLPVRLKCFNDSNNRISYYVTILRRKYDESTTILRR